MIAARPPVRRVAWPKTFRIIPSRHPLIDLFERIADPADWETLAEIEMLTNPRTRQDWGQISLVPPERRVSGPGASWIMGPFVHLRDGGTRFARPPHGAYYASRHLETAVAETTHHMARFYARTNEPPCREAMRVLIGRIDARLSDIRGDARFAFALDPDDYTMSQALGMTLRHEGSNGIVYPSVRHKGGENVAAFWPNVVPPPIQGPHLTYEWTGQAISRYFDDTTDTWKPAPA